MNANYHILLVVGARPQIMKAAAMARALDEFAIFTYEIIHSGQHYDASLSDDFFRELSLKSPKYNLQIGSKSHNLFMAEFLIGFDTILTEENPDMVVVVGDTNTTAAAAIASAKRNFPLAHVEAGLREWDKSVPEEVNKLLTDSVTDLFFPPTQTGLQNLIAAGIQKDVHVTGDITLDLLTDNRFIWDEDKTKETFHLPQDYIFMTCHRASNTQSKLRLQEIVEAINQIEMVILWTLHPRTRKALLEYDLMETLKGHIRLAEPLSYTESQSLIRHAELVITDSGGVIKEAYFHSTPSIIIDDQTEWVEVVHEGWSIVAGASRDRILRAFAQKQRPTNNKQTLGSGKSGYMIVREIKKYLDKRRGA